MSIHFCVAATLARGVIAEANYRNLNDPEITRLASLTTLELDEELNAAYPQQQGSEVILTLRGGRTLSRRLPDVIPATPAEIRARFRKAAERYVDVAELESAIDTLETASSAARVAEVMAAK
jgi:2-methylcitrate dehydratase PrpD